MGTKVINGNLNVTGEIQQNGAPIQASAPIEKIQQNGVELTISNKTVNVTVPTKTSDLTNDGDGGDTDVDKFATKSFVNSSVATNTAYFLGTYNLVDDLGLSVEDADSHMTVGGAIAQHLASLNPAVTPSNNDYVFVQIPTAGVTPIAIGRIDRYKYSTLDEGWLYEYTLNNSSYTEAQWAAINSAITSTKVDSYDSHVADGSIHVSAADKAIWNASSNLPQRLTFAYNLVVNINQQQFDTDIASWSDVVEGTHPYRTFLYEGEIADLATAQRLLEFLTGSSAYDSYDADKPTPCFVFTTQNNTCWKLQWDGTTYGLRAYRVDNFPLQSKLTAGSGIIMEDNVISTNGVSNEVTVLTTAPTAENLSGYYKFVMLSAEPAEYFNGYIYIITDTNS